MIILPTLRPILNRRVSGGSGTLLWTTNFLSTATITAPSPNAAYTVSAGTGDGEGVFTNVLPSSGQYYFDCTLDDGYSTGGVGFFGFANSVSAFSYPSSSLYKAWYYSGAWWGDASTISAGSGTLDAGIYRIAVDRTNNRFYMQRTNNTPTAIRSANLPASTGANVYLMMMGQSGYKAIGVSIAGGGILNSGSGGLY